MGDPEAPQIFKIKIDWNPMKSDKTGLLKI
jgi:hypothetical protein